jgi:predicted amidohydrolase YtcJ
VVGEAHLGGRIAPGLRADLTGLEADPVDCPPDALPDVPVRLTVVDGAVVFRG